MYMAMNWKRNENWKIGSQFKEAIIITNAVCVMYFKTNYTLYLVLLHYYITLNAILWFFSNFISLAFRFKFDHRKKIASFDVIYWHQFNIREVVCICIFQLFKSIFLFYIPTKTKLHVQITSMWRVVCTYVRPTWRKNSKYLTWNL